MAENYQTVEYRDELLADKTVSREYSNNRREWRTLTADGRVSWRDSTGAKGVDELLGNGIVKRIIEKSDQPIYGREQGYGRTLWSNNVLTINRTSFEGGIGTALLVMGMSALIGEFFGKLVAPPLSLSAAEEEKLRQQQRAAQQQSSDSGGGSSSDSATADADWDDGSGIHNADSDFG